MTEAVGMNPPQSVPRDPVWLIVDRHIPPVPRRVVDHDLNGKPIYADEVIAPGG